MTENPSALVFGEGKKEKTTLDSYSFVRFGGFRFLLGAKNTIWPFYAQFFQGTYDCLNILATDRVLDAGANVGFFSIFAASKCQKVIAVEPNPINFRVLMLNKSMNKASNVILVNKALSDKEGYVRMSGEGVVFKISSGGVTIPAITIDSLIRGLNYDVSVVKMDIEGAEERCLEGSYLEKVREIVIETHSTTDTVIKILKEHGFVPKVRRFRIINIMKNILKHVPSFVAAEINTGCLVTRSAVSQLLLKAPIIPQEKYAGLAIVYAKKPQATR